MKNIYIIIVFLIFFISIGVDLYFRSARRKFSQYVVGLLVKNNFRQFDEIVKSRKAKRLIPKYNLMYLKFNSFILRDKKRFADQIFQQMLDKDFTSKQKIIFYGKALNYYIEQKDNLRATQCFNEIKKIKHYNKQKNRLINIYEVIVLKKFNCINEILKRIDNDNLDEKVTDYYLISHIYGRLNNTKKAKKYNQLADDTITQIVS